MKQLFVQFRTHRFYGLFCRVERCHIAVCEIRRYRVCLIGPPIREEIQQGARVDTKRLNQRIASKGLIRREWTLDGLRELHPPPKALAQHANFVW